MSFQKLNRIPLYPSIRNSINIHSQSNNGSDKPKENPNKTSFIEQTSKEHKISQNEENVIPKCYHNCSNTTKFLFSPLRKENNLSLSIIEGKQRIALNRLNDTPYDEGISTFEDSLLKGSICKHKEKDSKRGIVVDSITSNTLEIRRFQDIIENNCQPKSCASTTLKQDTSFDQETKKKRSQSQIDSNINKYQQHLQNETTSLPQIFKKQKETVKLQNINNITSKTASSSQKISSAASICSSPCFEEIIENKQLSLLSSHKIRSKSQMNQAVTTTTNLSNGQFLPRIQPAKQMQNYLPAKRTYSTQSPDNQHLPQISTSSPYSFDVSFPSHSVVRTQRIQTVSTSLSNDEIWSRIGFQKENVNTPSKTSRNSITCCITTYDKELDKVSQLQKKNLKDLDQYVCILVDHLTMNTQIQISNRQARNPVKNPFR